MVSHSAKGRFLPVLFVKNLWIKSTKLKEVLSLVEVNHTPNYNHKASQRMTTQNRSRRDHLHNGAMLCEPP